ncbi:MAG: hypothetical protein OEU46_11725 [Alphaproteobacteria bacterium]|nr:hypothetical protein [Alphaproteobacteria bacterium]
MPVGAPIIGRVGVAPALGIVALLALAGCAESSRGWDVKAHTPQKAFEIYRVALLEADGATAAGIVTRRTHRYYDEVRQAALYSRRGELDKLSVQKKMVTLLFRLRFSGEQLKSMTGRDVFANAVQNGMIGTEGARRLRLTDYEITGRVAKAHILGAKGPVRRFTFDIKTEDGGWKVDLISLLRLLEMFMWVSLDRSGADNADDFIISSLEQTVGRRVGPEVWKPLLPR